MVLLFGLAAAVTSDIYSGQNVIGNPIGSLGQIKTKVIVVDTSIKLSFCKGPTFD